MATRQYQRTVDAAVAETASKFRLAEALALDIPPRQPGPQADEPVNVYLAQAQAAITNAGGEYRSIETLADYRKTAMWVQGVNTPNFQWVTGASYTAHNEARKAGWSYEQFAANPAGSKREGREELYGKPMSDVTPDKAVAAWTPEQRGQALRSMMLNPDEAEQALAAAGRHTQGDIAGATSRLIERENLGRSRPEPREREIRDDLNDMAQASIVYDRARRAIQELIGLLQESPLLAEREDWRQAVRAQARWLRNASDLMDGLAAGESDDEKWSALLAEGTER